MLLYRQCMTILGSMFLANGCRVFVYLLYLSVFSYLSLCLLWRINLFISTVPLQLSNHHCLSFKPQPLCMSCIYIYYCGTGPATLHRLIFYPTDAFLCLSGTLLGLMSEALNIHLNTSLGQLSHQIMARTS